MTFTYHDTTISNVMMNHPSAHGGYRVECNGKSVFFSEPRAYNIYDSDDTFHGGTNSSSRTRSQTSVRWPAMPTSLLSMRSTPSRVVSTKRGWGTAPSPRRRHGKAAAQNGRIRTTTLSARMTGSTIASSRPAEADLKPLPTRLRVRSRMKTRRLPGTELDLSVWATAAGRSVSSTGVTTSTTPCERDQHRTRRRHQLVRYRAAPVRS